MKEFLLVGFGGMVGSMARHGVQILSSNYFSGKTMWGTMAVNLLGCFLIGLLVGTMLKLNQSQTLLLVTGLCGGFTTFSTFALDGLKLLKTGLYGQFFLYAGISIVGGLFLSLLGLMLSDK